MVLLEMLLLAGELEAEITILEALLDVLVIIEANTAE